MNDIQNDFISGIGNTPLIKLRAASEITGCNIFGKAEFLNPGGSVKDRAALALIKDAQEKKLIAKGGTVVEGTAGNTGIGLGLLGNSLGYKTIIVMKDNQTQEKKDLLRNLGAELKLVPAKPYKDDNNFVKVAARLADELRPTNNNGVIWANQFDNTANAKGHYEGTGKEIWDQTEGKVDGFVCSSGSGGTISGVSYALKEKSHVKIDIIYNSLNKKNQYFISMLGTIIFIIPTSLFITYSSIDMVTQSWSLLEGSSEAGGLDLVFILKSVIPITGVLIFLQALSDIIKYVDRYKT